MLGFRVQADAPALTELQGFHQVDDLLQGRDFQAAVEARVARADIRDALDGAQGLQFGEGEIFAEPAGKGDAIDLLGALAIGKLGALRDVGGQAQFVVVSGDDLAVAGHHQVRLDIVGALEHGQGIGGQGVLRQVAAGAAVGDHQRGRLAARGLVFRGMFFRRSEADQWKQQGAGGQPAAKGSGGLTGHFGISSVWMSQPEALA